MPTPSEATPVPQTEQQVLLSSSAIEPTQLGEFVEKDSSKIDAEHKDMDTFFLMEYLKPEAGTKSAVTTGSAKAVGDSASTPQAHDTQNQQAHLMTSLN